jgi:hypothetical protein
MKRNLIGSLSLVALSLLLTATGAYAQSGVQASVPFAFMVGTTQLPAGTYKIREYNRNLITIGNANTQTTTLALYQSEAPRKVNDKLLFHHVGNQYFLAEIWGAPGNSTIAFPTSKLEKHLRAVQVASGPANDSKEVMIALK